MGYMIDKRDDIEANIKDARSKIKSLVKASDHDMKIFVTHSMMMADLEALLND